jgi:sulfate permease, SulP family
VDADQELNANALANVASALFGGMIAGGGMSSSAVKEGAGARTQVANLVTWLVAIVTVLFFTPLFASLPEAVLGALIIHAVWHIIASRKLMKLRQAAPAEFWFGVVALWGVLLVDVLEGMVIGLLASLLFVVYRTARPHVSSLGRVPGKPGVFSDMGRHPDDIAVPGVLIVRPDAQLYYANALSVRDRVKAMIDEAEQPPNVVVFDMSAQDQLDLTSGELLATFAKGLKSKGVTVYMAEVHLTALEDARRTGLLEVVGEQNTFATVEEAVSRAEAP